MKKIKSDNNKIVNESSNNDIIMIIYNIKDLDGIKYELKMKLVDIYKLIILFKSSTAFSCSLTALSCSFLS